MAIVSAYAPLSQSAMLNATIDNNDTYKPLASCHVEILSPQQNQLPPILNQRLAYLCTVALG
jgi:hypothetical protein